MSRGLAAPLFILFLGTFCLLTLPLDAWGAAPELEVLVNGHAHAGLSTRTNSEFDFTRGERFLIETQDRGWFKILGRGRSGWVPAFHCRVLGYPGPLPAIGYTLEANEPLYREYFPRLLVKDFLPPFTPFILLRRDVKPFGIFLVVSLADGREGFLHLHSRGSRNLVTGRPIRPSAPVAAVGWSLAWSGHEPGRLVLNLSDGSEKRSLSMLELALFLEETEFERLRPWMRLGGMTDLHQFLEEMALVSPARELLAGVGNDPVALLARLFEHLLFDPAGRTLRVATPGQADHARFLARRLAARLEIGPESSDLADLTAHRVFFPSPPPPDSPVAWAGHPGGSPAGKASSLDFQTPACSSFRSSGGLPPD